MAVIAIKTFGGISPKTPPRYLQDSQAQVAVNCPVFNGSLQPLPDVGPTLFTLPKVGVPKTIYRFGQDLISDTQYWFHWTTDVDVVRSQIPSDTSEWTFYTGDGAPKATYAAIALSGGTQEYPTVSRPLGIPAPETAATVDLVGSPTEATDLPETRVYTYTLVSKEAGFEAESAPAPASFTIDVRLGQSVLVENFAVIPSGYNITHRRIYRAVSGVFLFVAEIAVSATSYSDTILAEDLGEELPSLTWLPPPATLKGLVNLPGGVIAGFTGRDIFFCDPYRPYAWPVQYQQSVDFPVVGLGRTDTTLVVLTTGTPYFIQGSAPDSMVVVKSDLEQACASKRSIVSTNGAVIYASPDGLVMLMPGGSRILTEQLFTRAQWQTLKPESIHAYAQDLKYVAFYDTGTTQGGFIYDLTSGQFVLHDIYATAGYADLVNDKLFTAFADRTIKAWQAGAAKSYTWRSKKFTMPRVMSFAAVQIEAEAYPVTLKVYADDSATPLFTQVVASREPFKLPVRMARDWEFQVEADKEVFSIAMGQSEMELANV
jgi:hypothetical protein